jgi:hypothetical protein
MQLCSELPSNFIFNGEIDYTKLKSFVDILPMPKGRGFLDTNDTCLLK